MFRLPSYARLQVSTQRLLFAVVSGVGFSLILYGASINTKSFNLLRCTYLLFGIALGAFSGSYEARKVTSNLNEQGASIPWQSFAFQGVMFVLALLFIRFLFGGSEIEPFMGFVVLSDIPTFSAASGCYYRRYEKRKNVKVMVSPFGFSYWSEPDVYTLKKASDSDIFQSFVWDVHERESMYEYLSLSTKLSKTIQADPNMDTVTKNQLLDLLNNLKRYRRLWLSFFAALFAAAFCLVLLFVSSGFGWIKVGTFVLSAIAASVVGCFLVGGILFISLFMRLLDNRTNAIMKGIEKDRLYALFHNDTDSKFSS